MNKLLEAQQHYWWAQKNSCQQSRVCPKKVRNQAESDVSKSAQAMEQAIKNMRHIEERNTAISVIMKVITDIADQTILLPLNVLIKE